MRVLVLWADGRSANLGVRVLAEGMAQLARDAWGDDIEVVQQDFNPNASGFSLDRKGIFKDLGRPRGPVKKFMKQFDVVLDTGAGDSFTDIYGLKRLALMVYTQGIIQRQRTPIALGPQTLGPFTTTLGRLAARRSLKRMAAVIARDSASAEYSKTLGFPVDALSTDVVFALPQPVPRGDHDVLVNVSGLLWSQNPHVDSELFQRQIRDLCGRLIQRGRRVTLLAHVIENATIDNDVPAVRALADQLDNSVDVLIPNSLEEVRAHIASSQLVIGSRMHACLNALSVGVPTIPWAYSRKFAPLMRDIGWKRLVDLREEKDPVAATLAILDQERDGALRSDARKLAADARDRLTPAIAALASIPILQRAELS